MSENVARGRRWPRWLLAAVLLVIGGPIAWKYRPLNATERQLVGRWKEVTQGQNTYRFLADRRLEQAVVDEDSGLGYQVKAEFGYSWTASPGALDHWAPRGHAGLDFLLDDPVETFVQYVKFSLGLARYSKPLRVVDPDHIVIGDLEFAREPE